METTLYQGKRVKISLNDEMEFFFDELSIEESELFIKYFRIIDSPVKHPTFKYQRTKLGRHIYQLTSKKHDIRGFWIDKKHFRITLIIEKNDQGLPCKLVAMPKILEKASESLVKEGYSAHLSN